MIIYVLLKHTIAFVFIYITGANSIYSKGSVLGIQTLLSKKYALRIFFFFLRNQRCYC